DPRSLQRVEPLEEHEQADDRRHEDDPHDWAAFFEEVGEIHGRRREQGCFPGFGRASMRMRNLRCVTRNVGSAPRSRGGGRLGARCGWMGPMNCRRLALSSIATLALIACTATTSG